jgi:AraC family L-rhamnose operon transcriptional activator RhaR/AraC family L-rhamnose operon regulatory protein RhaS
MRPEIKHHADLKGNFPRKREQVRAFIYTDYSYPEHDHEFYEMNVVLSGSGVHVIENARFNVKAGDVFMIPPEAIHAYYDTKGLDVYHVLFHRDFILENNEEAIGVEGYLQFIEIEPFLRQNAPDAMFLHLSQNELSSLKAELDLIADDGIFGDEAHLPIKKHTALKILYYLSELLHRQLNSEQKNSKNKYEQLILGVLEYIHKNFAEKITVEMLCKMTYLSRSTFLRSFFEMCSCSPIVYLNRYRCKKASELIIGGEYSKTEIAHKCGFYDLSHMERFLKKYR